MSLSAEDLLKAVLTAGGVGVENIWDVAQQKVTAERTADEDLFDMDFRRVRNRIEHFFGRIDKHRFFWYNCHEEDWNRWAFGFVFNALPAPHASRSE